MSEWQMPYMSVFWLLSNVLSRTAYIGFILVSLLFAVFGLCNVAKRCFAHIDDQKIITNAHVVANYTTVRVRRHGGQEKSLAKVVVWFLLIPCKI